MNNEHPNYNPLPAAPFIFGAILLVLLAGYSAFLASIPALILVAIPAVVAFFIVIGGLTTVEPKEAIVMLWFGSKRGTWDKEGLYWFNPFLTTIRVPLGKIAFETEEKTVPDADKTPLVVATCGSFRIINASLACFEIDKDGKETITQAATNYALNVVMSKLRDFVGSHPYDVSQAYDDDEDTSKEQLVCLAGNTETLEMEFLSVINKDLENVGLEVVSNRFVTLQPTPELSQVLTQQQQAKAVVNARKELSEGIVDIVSKTLKKIDEKMGEGTLSKEDRSSLTKMLTVSMMTHTTPTTTYNINE